MIEHDRHNGRFGVAEHATPDVRQASPQLRHVPSQAQKPLVPGRRAQLSQGRYRLLRSGRGHARRQQRRSAVPPQVGDHVLGGSQVAAHAAEGLGEGAHHHVDVSSVYTEEFSNPPTARPHRADRVRFVEIQISPILLLERDDFPQATEVALHGVDALHEHDDLAPRLHSGIRINVALGGLRVCKSNKT